MKDKKIILNTNNAADINLNELTADLFAPADQAERESVVQMHESIGYWKDAARRFKKNKVSMFALILFLVIMFYAYIGPYLIPYSYELQSRNAIQLGAFEYSEAEMDAQKALGVYDRVYSCAMIYGSLQSLKGNYYTKIDGTTYNFTFEKAFAEKMLIYDADSADKLMFAPLKEMQEDGSFESVEALPYTIGDPAEDAIEIKMIKKVFPHVFGTDNVGRDVMARTMYGTRISMLIGICAAAIVLVIGSTIGALAGLLGGKVDMIIMRYIDLLSSIPNLLMVMLLQVVIKQPLQNWIDYSDSPLVPLVNGMGHSVISLLIIYALLYWTGMARIVRGQVLMLRNQEFITAEYVLGANNKRIILKHLLPNCMGQLIMATVGQIPGAIFTESSLSYLGVGVTPPHTSLGALCSESIASLSAFPLRLLVPSILLSLIVLTLNLVGDGLRDALDPRLK